MLVFGGALIIPKGSAGIVYPQAPAGAEQAVSNALASRFLVQMDHLPPAKDLTIGRPFPVYFYPVKYTNLLSGQLLSATKFAGWRYLLTYGTNAAELQLPYDQKKRDWPEIGWQFYPALPSGQDPALETLQAAERLPQVKKEDYELRYLNFMEIQFFAVWLHGKSSDIIIPMPVYGKWQDHRPYSEGEMIEILKREIENKMKEPAHTGPGYLVD
jgi:hypothetical protein